MTAVRPERHTAGVNLGEIKAEAAGVTNLTTILGERIVLCLTARIA